MAKKKIYAVRKGHKTGLFYTWDECKKAVHGYSGAEYKGFLTKDEAEAFLNIGAAKIITNKNRSNIIINRGNSLFAINTTTFPLSFDKSKGKAFDMIQMYLTRL